MSRADLARGLLLSILYLAGCTGGSGGDANETQLQVDERAAARPEGALELGPIEDEDLRQVIYQGLGARLDKTLATGSASEETTEIGDYESFRFTILKLTRGTDDVSGDPSATPDGMNVEVSGWYRRTVSGEEDGKPQCTSFDAQLTMTRTQGAWAVSNEHPLTFGREDPEDCY